MLSIRESAMSAFPILMYHQVDAIAPKYGADGARARHRGLTVPVGQFARQMGLLKALGYRGVSMSDLMPYLRGEKRGKVVGITFDDGYRNNLTNALPVLRRYGFSSTCYVVSGLVGATNTWDRKNHVVEKPLMTADEVREWIAAGQEVGSHTCHHVDLREVHGEAAKAEIQGSKAQLEALTGVPCRHFCYPYGSYRSEHVGLVREAGYESATTPVPGRAGGEGELLELPRIGVFKGTLLPKFFWGIRS